MEIFKDVNLLEIGDTNATSEAFELASRAAERRRRDVRVARDKLGEQFQELKSVLPCRDKGSELAAKSQILDNSICVIRQLMTKATTFSVGLVTAEDLSTRPFPLS